MKERFLTGLKNAAVMIIASLMLLGVIPLGMISLSTVSAEGDFLRLYPETQISLTPAGNRQNKGVFFEDEILYGVGKDRYGYLRFDLRELLDEKVEDINEATLRMTFLRTPATQKMPVRLWLMPEDNWSSSIKWKDKPSGVGEVLIKTVVLSSETEGEPRLWEVDLTNYLKKWIEEKREKVSFRLDGLSEGATTFLAGVGHEDPTFRPGLKVVTGEAKDPDEKNLKKVTLKETFATKQQGDSMAVVDEKNEIFLNFALNPNNIQGAVYQANLKLQCLAKSPEARLRIERLDNTKWKAGTLKEGEQPKGNRYLVYREEDARENGYDAINLSEVMMDAIAQGKTRVTLVLFAEGGEIAFGIGGKTRPSVKLQVSDGRDALALAETIGGMLGENANRGEITQSLCDDRIAENGVRTAVEWNATNMEEPEQQAGDVLTTSGRIIRPKWYQESRDIVARTEVSAGKYRADLMYYLSVLPQEEPDLSGMEFGSMVDIGSGEKEKEQLAESTGAMTRSRWVDGKKLTCREMGKGGMMVLHLAVDPQKQNYLTVKLWGEDEFSGLLVSDLQNRKQKSFKIRETEMATTEESGFCYLTYPIPLAYTQKKQYVSLRLTMIAPDVDEMMEASLEDEPTVSVYSAYVTQTPYFDPMNFAPMGEPVIKKEEESSFRQFLGKIYGAAERAFDFRDTENPEETLSEESESGVYTDVENQEQTALVFGKEEQLMLNLPEKGKTAKIYRDTSYYNAYAEMPVKEYEEQGLQTVDYGIFRIFRNRGGKELKIPWQEESLSGLYRNLATEAYYSFLSKGQMVDDSVLPEGTSVADGREFVLNPGDTVVLMKMAEPLYYPDFRVSEINGVAVANIKWKEEVSISSLTIRAMGSVPKEEKQIVMFVGVYERGFLVRMDQQFLTVSPGQVAAEILPAQELLVKPGQNLKVFVEDRTKVLGGMTPILELPQKQPTIEKKVS